MEELGQMKCVACRKGAPQATEEEITEFLPQVPEWKIVERNSINRLQRIYRFNNFVDALAFTNKVGELAEAEGHHPALLTEWGKVKVTCRSGITHTLCRQVDKYAVLPLRQGKRSRIRSASGYRYGEWMPVGGTG